jgi:histidine triad (HIT) family protein
MVVYFMEKDCIFCKIVSGEIPCEKVIENDDFIVIKDANQKVEGHSLVIPKKHYKVFLDMPKDLYCGLFDAAREAVGNLGSDNFNLVINNGKIAGQLVPHVHLHILPRKKGDGFKLGI